MIRTENHLLAGNRRGTRRRRSKIIPECRDLVVQAQDLVSVLWEPGDARIGDRLQIPRYQVVQLRRRRPMVLLELLEGRDQFLRMRRQVTETGQARGDRKRMG